MSARGIISSSWLLVLRTLFYNRYWMRTANVICSSMRGVLSELAHAHHSVCAAHALATGLISAANAQPECQFYDELVVYRPQLLYYSNGDEWEPAQMSPTIDKCQRRCSLRSTDLIIKCRVHNRENACFSLTLQTMEFVEFLSIISLLSHRFLLWRRCLKPEWHGSWSPIDCRHRRYPSNPFLIVSASG